jgi:hypothetical protein
MTKYYFIKNGKKQGPFSKEELSRQPISAKTLVWFHPLDDWTLLSDLPELSDIDRMAANEKKEKSINVWAVMIGLSILISIVQFWPSSGSKGSDPKPVANSAPPSDVYRQISSSAIDSDIDFDMYVEKFYRDTFFMDIYPPKPKTIIIKLAPLDEISGLTHYHGISFGSDDDTKIEIYINPTTWEKFNKPMRYALMYHELAHDVLNLGHLKLAESNAVKQLMAPTVADGNFTMDEFIESYKALFTNFKIENP